MDSETPIHSTKPRDSNHAFRYYYLKSKREYRDNVASHTIAFWTAMVDIINAAAKTILGLLGTIFSLASEICLKSQKSWSTQTETIIKEGSVHKVN